MTFKNTVASSIPEIKSFVQEVLAENGISRKKFILDFSKMGRNDLWYL